MTTTCCLVSFYGYMDVCKYDMCYSVRSINFSYDIETDNVTMDSSLLVPYFAQEILPPAKILLLNDTGYHATVFGDKYLFVESIDHEADSSIFGLKFQSHGTRMFVNGEELPFNETQWNCSIVPKQTWTFCVCKVHGHVVEFCSRQNKTKFNPAFSAYGSKHYNIYGTTKIGQPFDYYFKLHVLYGNVFPSCATASTLDLVQKKESRARLGIGSNSSFIAPDLSVCGEHNGTSVDVNQRDNFTVFMTQNTDSNKNAESWKLLVRFDWRKWVKNYQPGNCHYVHQMFEDGTPQDYCVCMRLNVTERFCNSYLREPESSTSRSTVDIHEIKTTPYPEEPLSMIETIESKQNISEEETNAFLEEIDALLGMKNSTQKNLSSLFDTLNSLMTKSCCNIHFVGNTSITALRKSVDCTKSKSKEWPVLTRNTSIKSQYHKSAFGTSIWIPQESVCHGTKANEEYVLIYYLFYNRALFTEKTSDLDNSECILKFRSLSKYSPVLSAQLIRDATKEHIHQILVDGKYMPMARIAIDKEEDFQLLPLHGALKLAYWNRGEWKSAESARLKGHDNYYLWEVDHLTDFTLVVVGLFEDIELLSEIMRFKHSGIHSSTPWDITFVQFEGN
ncbi:hypothetical protein DdX_13992 [Ditylenchus destructor]|uniref:Uncharacterized protein n=1 Tax=Ditylenchus destructor TaxID=166010 RepID=A0AAD4MTG1_9BILA|nr:hypothetical protein DdX_13992 [Ditylenchus destructor]